jgi:hypothetical protein
MSQLSGRAGELAPSETRAETLTLTRIGCGFGGLFLFTLGVASVIAARYEYGLLGANWGYLSAFVGLGLLFVHSVRDTDPEVRRVYGLAGVLFLLLAVGVGVYPAKPDGAAAPVAGQLLLPWGALFGFVSLLFLVPFARNETAEPYRSWAHLALLGTGGLLCAGAVVCGLVNPAGLVAPAIILGLLGVAFLCGYYSVADSSADLPHWAATGLGVLGAATVVYAVGRTVLPTVLYEGSAALLRPNQTTDPFKVFGRGLVVLAGFASLLAVRSRTLPAWLKFGLPVVGLVFAGVFLFGSFGKNLISTAPTPFLVPGGVVLTLLGLAFAAVGVGVTSDAPLVVLTRRELAAFFYSPIVYIVLFGSAVAAGLGHRMFLQYVMRNTLPEPVLVFHPGLGILAGIIVLFVVPALTMRALSEERRTGTLEVLLTAPVNEWAVLLSKFAATLLVYMLTWLPQAVFLVVLCVIGKPYDVRPLLSYYLAVFAAGCGFVAMGLFFSGLTRNQVVAAVLTFAGMVGLFMVRFVVQRDDTFQGLSPEAAQGLAAFLQRFAFLQTWETALDGQLELPAVVVSLSMAVFWLVLTAKLLEARKWS